MKPLIQTAAPTELATLLIPINGRQLILPNVTVAEIIPYTQPEAADDVPTWFLGYFPWRSQQIPLVCFEAINEEPFANNSADKRIAVLNGLVGERLPFCGIVTSGAPRLLRVLPDEMSDDANHTTGPAELARVMINGEHAAIPDVDFIQQQVLQLL
jgi:chemosensory pili system protein ChpC